MPASVRILGRDIRLTEAVGQSTAAGTPLGRLILEKLPLLAMSAVSCAVTLWAQTESIAVSLPFAARAANALSACLGYMMKTVWPIPLYINYPYPHAVPVLTAVTAALTLGGLSVVAVRQARRRPYFFTGWFWFLGTLVPVIGLVQVGYQSMADRYTYIPLVGLFVVMAWGGHELAVRCRLGPAVTGALASVLVVACLPVTAAQVRRWNNSIALCEHALRFNRDNFIVQYNLAVTLVRHGQLDAAAEHFAEAARVMPAYAPAHCGLGQVLIGQGRFEEAIGPYRAALRRDPKLASAQYGLGVALHRRGESAEAAEHLKSAIELAPKFWEAHDELGLVLSGQGKTADALEHFSEAARLAPQNVTYRVHLAEALYSLGRAPEAIAQYREVLKRSSDAADALNNLAWILATNPKAEVRDGQEAVRLAERACQLTRYRQAMLVGTLGVAYAEAGRFEEAVATTEKAAALATAAGDEETAAKSRALVELFRGRQPVHESETVPSTATPQDPSTR
jgi:tetratricopeptide (TPR) repeat protein